MNELMRRLLFLPDQASETARDIDKLHYFVISVTMIGSLAVGVTALWFVIRYRRRAGDAAASVTPRVNASGKLELGFISLLLGLFLVWWVIGYRQYLGTLDAPADAMTVYVTAKQWMWKFSYPEGRASAGVLVVPRGQPVRLALTSRDVIHSFYVPALRMKRDALPGRYTSAWFAADSRRDVRGVLRGVLRAVALADVGVGRGARPERLRALARGRDAGRRRARGRERERRRRRARGRGQRRGRIARRARSRCGGALRVPVAATRSTASATSARAGRASTAAACASPTGGPCARTRRT